MGLQILFYSCLLTAAFALDIPSYLTLCSLSDKKLEECAVKSGNEALPFVVKGDPEHNLPSLAPLKISEIVLAPNENFNIVLTDINLIGLDKTIIKDIKFDFINRHCKVIVQISHAALYSHYVVDGRVLVLPIRGSGPANITFVNGVYEFDYDYDLILREDNKEYIQFTNNNLEYVAERIYIKLDNLFNGNKLLGMTVNTFLDANWKTVMGELYPSLKKTIGNIISQISSQYLTTIPFELLFTK